MSAQWSRGNASGTMLPRPVLLVIALLFTVVFGIPVAAQASTPAVDDSSGISVTVTIAPLERSPTPDPSATPGGETSGNLAVTGGGIDGSILTMAALALAGGAVIVVSVYSTRRSRARP